MEYTGLLHKYPINRELTEEERRDHLKQKQRLDGETIYQLSVIRINSTFVELTGKFYAWKGVVTTASLLGIWLFVGMGFQGIWQDFDSYQLGRRSLSDALIQATLLFLFSALSTWPLVWLLRKECFTYTHYPIRLNRKTRMVHVFRLNGTVLSVPWDEVFFCLSYCRQGMWDVQGHVLDPDGVTVRETFSLPVIGGRSKGDQQGLRMYWEFVRRYMEEGPAEAARMVTIFMPIAERRESFMHGFHRMHAEASGGPFVFVLFFAVVALVMAPGRWIAMRTSKVPRWPAEIDAVCIVEPNDLFAKDASAQPGDRRS